MRGNLTGLDALSRVLDNMIMARQEQEIVVPALASFDDMLWKFDDDKEPKSFWNCEKAELVSVVRELLEEIKELNNQLNVERHAKQAVIGLL